MTGSIYKMRGEDAGSSTWNSRQSFIASL